MHRRLHGLGTPQWTQDLNGRKTQVRQESTLKGRRGVIGITKVLFAGVTKHCLDLPDAHPTRFSFADQHLL